MRVSIFIFALITNFNVMAYKVGAENLKEYEDIIKDKKIGLIVNQSSLVGQTHLIDFLLSKNHKVKKLFALEHGIRGKKGAGEQIRNGKDVKTGLPVISLYGKKKTPNFADLKNIDILIFDIQDMGVRFYTYIASLGNIMKAGFKHKKTVIVLDRPNPFTNIVDGPINQYKNFIAPYPIPILYGLTIGELALMIKKKKWISPHKGQLHVIKMLDFKRDDFVQYPTFPSPNLRQHSARINYPSLALFEASNMSLGRGTYRPFTQLGHPSLNHYTHSFIPKSLPELSKNPKHKNKKCFGIKVNYEKGFYLRDFIFFYRYFEDSFIKSQSLLNYLYGRDDLIKRIRSGQSESDIKDSYKKELTTYLKNRTQFLIY